jgi:hypothetical protein
MIEQYKKNEVMILITTWMKIEIRKSQKVTCSDSAYLRYPEEYNP